MFSCVCVFLVIRAATAHGHVTRVSREQPGKERERGRDQLTLASRRATRERKRKRKREWKRERGINKSLRTTYFLMYNNLVRYPIHIFQVLARASARETRACY